MLSWFFRVRYTWHLEGRHSHISKEGPRSHICSIMVTTLSALMKVDLEVASESTVLWCCSGGQLMWESELSPVHSVRDFRTSEEDLAPVLPTDLPCISASKTDGRTAAVVAWNAHGLGALELQGSGLHCEGLQVFCHDGNSVLSSTVSPWGDCDDIYLYLNDNPTKHDISIRFCDSCNPVSEAPSHVSIFCAQQSSKLRSSSKGMKREHHHSIRKQSARCCLDEPGIMALCACI